MRYRIRRIRVDGSRVRKEKVADSKISGYVWTGPKSWHLCLLLWCLPGFLTRHYALLTMIRFCVLSSKPFSTQPLFVSFQLIAQGSTEFTRTSPERPEGWLFLNWPFSFRIRPPSTRIRRIRQRIRKKNKSALQSGKKINLQRVR